MIVTILFTLSLVLKLNSNSNKLALCFHNTINTKQYRHHGHQSLKASSISSSSNDIKTTTELMNDDKDVLTLPWSDMQEWALKDNISKYTITIPTKNNNVNNVNNNNNNNYSFILWNTMINEVTELHGYTISYLSTKLSQNMNMALVPVPVPYMTNYEFVNNGGIKGEVYNKEGIADGSIIITNPLMNVRNTLPNGYVQTISNNDNDNDTIGIIYELGYALSYSNDKLQRQQQYSSIILQSLSNANNNIMTTATTNANTNTENNYIFDLVKNVGGVTAIALGSGIVYNLLTHHLTVNVFWV